MVHEDQSRKKYPSDLTDEQWAIVGPMIPPAKQNPRGGRPRKVDMREVLNTLFYLNRSGCQWDMLPHDLLPKSTVYDYFCPVARRWDMGEAGQGLARADSCGCGARARPPVPPASIVNRSRPPRWEARTRGYDGGKKINGRKRHLLVDTLGLVAGRAHYQCGA